MLFICFVNRYIKFYHSHVLQNYLNSVFLLLFLPNLSESYIFSAFIVFRQCPVCDRRIWHPDWPADHKMLGKRSAMCSSLMTIISILPRHTLIQSAMNEKLHHITSYHIRWKDLIWFGFTWCWINWYGISWVKIVSKMIPAIATWFVWVILLRKNVTLNNFCKLRHSTDQ